jgi:hypothetical protein
MTILCWRGSKLDKFKLFFQWKILQEVLFKFICFWIYFYQNCATDGKSKRMYVHLYMKVENKMMAETKTICHTLLFDYFIHDEIEHIVVCLSLS